MSLKTKKTNLAPKEKKKKKEKKRGKKEIVNLSH